MPTQDTTDTYPFLDEEFSAYLHDRAVPKDVAAERGYQKVFQGNKKGGKEFAAAWGFPQKAAGLLIPLHGILDDGPKASVQLRISSEIQELFKDNKGRPRKFLTPQGQRNVLATAPRTRAHLSEPRQGLIIAEGVTRVDALAAYGIPAVGMTGIWNWRGLTVLPDFEAIAFKGNRIVIAPDGDVRTNRKVLNAVTRLQNFLKAKGADSVQVLVLPDGQGLDDWIKANEFESADELMAAMREFLIDDFKESDCQHVMPPTDPDKARPKQAYPWYSEADFLSLWDRTPDADCMRTLRLHGVDLLCVKQEGEDMYVLTATKGGRWSEDYDALGKLIGDTALEWMNDALKTGGMTEREFGKLATYAAKLRSDEGRQKALRSTGRVVERWRDDKALPSGLTLARAEDLNAQKRYLGAPNGVIDLQTRDLLTGTAAREALVTRTVPVTYDPEAQHDDVKKLFDHLTAEDFRYLLAALGFALYGTVGKRFYPLIGPPDAGKSTLFAALMAALGDVKRNGYGMGLNIEALIAQRYPTAHQGGLFGLQDARIAFTSEMPDNNSRLDVGLLKKLDGIEPLPIRDVGEKAGPADPSSATVFIGLNDGDAHRLPFRVEAIRVRARVLNYPKVPKKDEGLVNRVRRPVVARAMLALLVMAASKNPKPPMDIPSVTAAGTVQFRDTIGDVGEWLLDNVVADPGGQLTSDELWGALTSALGKPDAEGKIDGWTRKELLRKLAPEVISGWPPKAERRGAGGRLTVYQGVRLGARPRLEEDAETRPCEKCKEPFYPPTETPDARFCGTC